ncbi:selenium metabolism-associated LysR family transcriptional regulator [Marinicrinis sediminis]|uniref:Selenium metabolism-associated LysR family transcriptional regulator n=1 Tax=Marinicrinis sediminis TaxID=1652465 RepID=A0ABW5R731_9BACL
MAINFHQLHIFYTVAERGSFSSAAQMLHMSQPAVTMQIQSLEDYFGVKLFHRSTKKVVLSEAGKTLMPYAKKSMQIMKDTEQAMASYTESLKGELQLGASLTIGESILPRLLGYFSKQYTHISYKLKVMNTTQIMEEVLNHQLHIGLVEAEIKHPELTVEPVLNDELMLIVPKGHPLFEQETVTLEEVLRQPFVLREQGSGTRQVIEEVFMEHGVSPETLPVVMELGSTGAVKSAVEAGLGVSILSAASVKHEVALDIIRTKPITGMQMRRHFYIIHEKDRLLPLPATTFQAFIQEKDMKNWNLMNE